MMPFPALLPVSEIQERLRVIFPQGTPNRNYVTREIAAKTIFVLLYIGAIDGNGRWLRPDQVTRMTDVQATLTDNEARESWLEASLRPATGHIEGRWYAANTREPIRDETLREGLVRLGAVKERDNIPTTSPRPRYALTMDFAALFDPGLASQVLATVITDWQEANLSSGALAGIVIMRRGAVRHRGRVLVTFPSGETRSMEPGPSSILSKAVVSGRRTVRNAFSGTPSRHLVEREPQPSGGARRPTRAGHRADHSTRSQSAGSDSGGS